MNASMEAIMDAIFQFGMAHLGDRPDEILIGGDHYREIMGAEDVCCFVEFVDGRPIKIYGIAFKVEPDRKTITVKKWR